MIDKQLFGLLQKTTLFPNLTRRKIESYLTNRKVCLAKKLGVQGIIYSSNFTWASRC